MKRGTKRPESPRNKPLQEVVAEATDVEFRKMQERIFNIDERLPTSLVLNWLEVLWEFRHQVPPKVLSAPKHETDVLYGLVLKRLEENGATNAFNRLVAAGCNDSRLAWVLALVAKARPKQDNLINVFGFRRREMRAVTRRMRQCAEDFKRLDRYSVLNALAGPRLGLTFLENCDSIPEWLNECAAVLETTYRRPDLKRRSLNSLNLALAGLVAYVLKRTTEPHDNEVSELVNAVRSKRDPDHPFTTDALKEWRSKNARSIREASESLPQFLQSP